LTKVQGCLAPLTTRKRLQIRKFTLSEAPVAARVIIVVTTGSGDKAAQLAVCVVRTFGVGQVLGVMIRCVW